MPEKAEKIWERVKKILGLQKGINISEPDYQMFLETARLKSFENNHLYLEVDNNFIKKQFEEKLSPKINEILNGVLLLDDYTDVIIEIKKEQTKVVDEEILDALLGDKPKKTKNDSRYDIIETRLQAKHTFEDFVVGKSNEFAYATSVAAAKEPGKRNNPLFLYGDVGLGKTHLMQAIGNEVKRKDNNKKIYYCSSEQFTNDMIESIKNGKMNEFRNKYRKLDMLLIDDIQFIAGKETTQEEFFHTFNELHQAGKQIVLSSDRPPKAIDKIEKRLVSRFEWGIAADIGQPDYETRVAILQKKAEQEHIYVAEKVLRYIAESINSNIRELEGALNKMIALASIKKQDITIELVEDALYEVVKSKSKLVTKEKVLSVVSAHFDVTEEDMKSKKRKKEIAHSRQVSMYLMREMLEMQLTSIGSVFGGKDHSTVLHSISKVEEEMKENKYFLKDINMLKEKIKN